MSDTNLGHSVSYKLNFTIPSKRTNLKDKVKRNIVVLFEFKMLFAFSLIVIRLRAE